LLRSARNLEAAGKSAGALTIYQQVVKEYPGTPQATMAAQQIQAIKAP
jgi:TolA-binding protein